jgi:hypothetical protein
VNTKLLCLIGCAAFSSLAMSPARAEESRKTEARHPAATHTAEASALRKEAAEKPPAPEKQQDRMKRCNVEAGKKSLHGEERRAFMSSCLKG